MENSWVDRILGADVNYIALAVPAFFILILAELFVGFLKGREIYRLNCSVADLSCGIVSELVKVLIEVFVLGVYIVVYENFRCFDIINASPVEKTLWSVGLFLGVDFCFYWHHRFAHEIKAGWAAHVVHHQSEDFNLAVALRQSTLEHHLVIGFYLPLALLGFPPAWFVAMFAFNLIWQFGCHTQLINKMGPLEWIFVTPSHHRVHHARNPQYIDRNYGGTLIIWDKLFGTFEPEKEACVYGITTPLRSWNPLYANYQVWGLIWDECKHARRWIDKVRLWLMPLNWVPEGVEPKPDPSHAPFNPEPKYDVAPSRPIVMYALAQFVVTLIVGAGFLLMVGDHANLLDVWDLVAFILASLTCVGGYFEAKRWAISLDIVRLVALPFVAFHQAGSGYLGIALTVAAAAVSVASLLTLRYVTSTVSGPDSRQAVHQPSTA